MGGATEATQGPVRVSNLHSIHVEVSIAGSRFPLESLQVAPTAYAAQTLEISVRELPAHRVVPIKLWQMGNGGTARTQTARLDIEVPLDAALARSLIEEAVAAAEKDEEKNIAAGKADPRLLEQLRRDHDRLVSLFQQEFFHESRTGVFEVQATYRSSAQEFWNGTLASDPVSFEIVYEGDYLEKHHLR